MTPDALTTCNACEVNPADPSSEAGYCADCHAEAGERQDAMAERLAARE